MSLLDAVKSVGPIPSSSEPQSKKKRYSERLSAALAQEVAEGLRLEGFPNVKPSRRWPGEKEFQGGLGPKKVDVSYSDERNGLLLAVSIKSICFKPFGKNLKNRFGDLCTEAITLHMRFPYSVVCALFAMPSEANQDKTVQRKISTFQRAAMLMNSVSGRQDYSSAGERFEEVVMLLFNPASDDREEPWVRLYTLDLGQLRQLSEQQFFDRLRDVYNFRNPHMQIGIEELKADGEDMGSDEG